MSQHPSSSMSSVRPRAPGHRVIRAGFDADDLAIVCLAFTATAVSVLTASGLLDLALCAVLWFPTRSADMVAVHNIATEALPWSLLFTAMAGGLTLAGLRLQSAVHAHAGPFPKPGIGFASFPRTGAARPAA